jgi:hypothetical protein
MTHLSESEFVDLAENEAGLSQARAAHVETCASCREQLDMVRSMLHESRSVDVPEPSPLFWDHMSMRVREGIAAESAPVRSGWNWIGLRGFVPAAAVAALIVAVVSGVLLMRAVRDGNLAAPDADRIASTPLRNVAPVPPRPETTPDADNAEVWALLTAVASDVAVEDARAAGMHVLPAAVDHAVQDLSEAELTELGRLLHSELKRSSN